MAGVRLDTGEPDIIIVGFDRTLTYASLEFACLRIRSGIPYYATHCDNTCPTEQGFIPDCGALVALIERATDRKPEKVFGKPGREIVEEALGRLKLPPENVAMVGDRLYTDMRMAYENDLVSILVLSGETTSRMVRESDLRPDLIADSLGELCRQ